MRNKTVCNWCDMGAHERCMAANCACHGTDRFKYIIESEVIDKKAREAIIKLANGLYGTILSSDFIREIKDSLNHD